MQTAFAPGRIELLGNHTDYNDGFVLSAAIDRGVTISGAATDDGVVTLRSLLFDEEVRGPLGNIAPLTDQPWANYPLGVVWCLSEKGCALRGFRAEFSSTLPTGAGLSSSAAMEVATAIFLTKLFGTNVAPMELAKLCRRAENEFVGVNCGLLDQVSSVFGRAHHAVFLDCRAETVELVPFPENVELLVAHSGVRHALTGGEYNERRAQCFAAAKALGVSALRDASSDQLAAAPLDPVVRRRATHIVGENERVLAGIDCLRRGDVADFGRLMFESHESSRVNFENSTPELDALVEITRGEPGVFGARLTGGGFGGATVSLVEKARAQSIAESVAKKYRDRTGNVSDTWVCDISDGAR